MLKKIFWTQPSLYSTLFGISNDETRIVTFDNFKGSVSYYFRKQWHRLSCIRSVFLHLLLRNYLSGDLSGSIVWWIIGLRSKTANVFMHEWWGKACSSICHIWKPRCRSQCNLSFTLPWPLPILSLGQCDNHLSNSMKPGLRLKVILHPKFTMRLLLLTGCMHHVSFPQYCRCGMLEWWNITLFLFLKK